MIPDYVPDEWTAATRKPVPEPRRRPLDPLGVTVWWVTIPLALGVFWAVVVGLIWRAAQ